MKWYEEHYVSHRDWILDKLGLLKLSPAELEVVLLIDFNNQYHLPTSMERLQEQSGLTLDEINSVVSGLVSRGYLAIKARSGRVSFRLDGLFSVDEKRAAQALDAPLIDVFESEFKRTLSANEMAKISDWNRTYDRRTILSALRQASMYQHLDLAYVEAILVRPQGKEESNEGRRNS